MVRLRSNHEGRPEHRRHRGLIGDHARAEILTALTAGPGADGNRAGAASPGCTKQTVSTHLAKLLEARLVAVESQGRHRYFPSATIAMSRRAAREPHGRRLPDRRGAPTRESARAGACEKPASATITSRASWACSSSAMRWQRRLPAIRQRRTAAHQERTAIFAGLGIDADALAQPTAPTMSRLSGLGRSPPPSRRYAGRGLADAMLRARLGAARRARA